MTRSTIDYYDELTASSAPKSSALDSPMSWTVQGWRERCATKQSGARGSRTNHRTAGLIVRRIVPVPILEGPLVAAPVINGELGGEERVNIDLIDYLMALGVP